MATIKFEHIETNGIQLHTAMAGSEDGQPVFLLHGFPDAWFGWEAQIKPLADSGFRVIVPDQRGYNLSAKPNGVANYKMDTLVKDILGLADSLGYDRFYLAGHDFGAMVSWNLVRKYPKRIKRLVIANVPHPTVMKQYLRTHTKQMLKSWYALFFQLPALPEFAVRAFNWSFLINAMPKKFSAAERDRYRAAWEQPDAMTGMINWYRASLRDLSPSTESPQIQAPTLMLWGQQDPHLSYEMAPLSIDLCEDGRLITYEDATHWVLHDKSAEVSREMVAFFSAQEQA